MGNQSIYPIKITAGGQYPSICNFLTYLLLKSNINIHNYKLQIDSSGNLYVITTTLIGRSYIFKSPNGTLNELTIDNSGNIYVIPDVEGVGVDSIILRSLSGDRYSLTVDNDSNLIQTEL
jgi:hypothetical protein